MQRKYHLSSIIIQNSPVHRISNSWSRQVIANDLSPAATAAIRRNLEINELVPNMEEDAEEKVKVVEGDAW